MTKIFAPLAVGALSMLAISGPSGGAEAFALACGSGQIENGSFEAPDLDTGGITTADITGGTAWDNNPNPRGWAMVLSLPDTDTAISRALVWRGTEGAVELQQRDDALNLALDAQDGDQWAEIAGAVATNILYQEVETVPGTVMSWSLYHRGLRGTDVMEVRIGPNLNNLVAQTATPSTSGLAQQQPTYIIDDTSGWRQWTGAYTVPAGQTTTVFGFAGVSTANNQPNVGNLLDNISFSCDAALTAAANPVVAQADSRPLERAETPLIHLDVLRDLPAHILYEGEGLGRGQVYSVSLGGRLLTSGVAGKEGYFSEQLALPPLATGTHEIVLRSVAPDGSPLVLTKYVEIGPEGQIISVRLANNGPELANTGTTYNPMLFGGMAVVLSLGGIGLVILRRRFLAD